MGTFTWTYFIRSFVANNWLSAVAATVGLSVYFSWERHTDRTRAVYKNQSSIFGGRKVPPGEDPWKY